ncbi:MAG TPA: bifunctional glutamate N-acetyltransferase/amino-acid acetyltransferase ArgJ [Anaerolineales bacterium]|nr:bifunctional glutamate N-acetyltransferase/amino-acid acetyltransferase ArgJ [Anaerolineales bacterium]
MSSLLPNGSCTTPLGFRASGVWCGLRKNGEPDVAMIESPTPCTAAGVFTRNRVVAAPVWVCRETLAHNNSHLRGVIINARNANACTGELGLQNARRMQALAAAQVSAHPTEFLVMSTGVIGLQMDMPKIESGIISAGESLSAESGLIAAKAIMTTDTHPKHGAICLQLSGGRVTIGGMCKGAGMIHPNMATMLSVLTTDAELAPEKIHSLLTTAVNASFNRVSVDGDTSTNDSLVLLANGASGVGLATADDEALFAQALQNLCLYLAKQIARDGEGATKLVSIQVFGAPSDSDAHQIANTIATSPLVKTAFAGSDPNWGRILAAAGRAGVAFEQSHANLFCNLPGQPALQLLAAGTPTDYLEASAAAIFAQSEFEITLQLGAGNGSATVYTCDLSADYVRINADYRT